MHGFPRKTRDIHRKRMDSLVHGFHRKTWENPQKIAKIPRKSIDNCMDSLEKPGKIQQKMHGLNWRRILIDCPKKPREFEENLCVHWSFMEIRRGSMDAFFLGSSMEQLRTLQHVTDTWWKFQQIIKCKKYMLATCQIFFWINNVSFSSRMVTKSLRTFWRPACPTFIGVYLADLDTHQTRVHPHVCLGRLGMDNVSVDPPPGQGLW